MSCAIVVTLVCRRVLYFLLCCWCCNRDSSKEKQGNPKFTSPYTIHIPRGQDHKVTKDDAAAGWQLVADPERPGCQMLVKKWVEDGNCCGVPVRAGEYMLTWQFISEHEISSYNILANPVYTGNVMAMLDGRDHAISVRFCALNTNVSVAMRRDDGDVVTGRRDRSLHRSWRRAAQAAIIPQTHDQDLSNIVPATSLLPHQRAAFLMQRTRLRRLHPARLRFHWERCHHHQPLSLSMRFLSVATEVMAST